MHLYGAGHHDDLSTGIPVACDASPLKPPDDGAWWDAVLERMPVRTASNNPTEQQTPLEIRRFPEAVVIANKEYLGISLPEEPSHDLVTVNPSLPSSSRIGDPLFTRQVEHTSLAPICMSDGPGLGEFMSGSLNNFSPAIPASYQSSYPPLGTLLHSWEYSVS
jgi:hypothetical protein